MAAAISVVMIIANPLASKGSLLDLVETLYAVFAKIFLVKTVLGARLLDRELKPRD